MATLSAAEGPSVPFLHQLFTDGMVLQRDVKAPVWGWTTPGATVQVAMQGQKATATAGSDGRWQAALGPFPAGGPFTMTVSGPETITVKDVLVGDVWLCSGQSNMAVQAPGDEVAKADYPNLRLFSVPAHVSYTPEVSVASAWRPCTPATFGQFSAVGYHFGREVLATQNIPVGLIHSAYEGSAADGWVSAAGLAGLKGFSQSLSELAVQGALIKVDGGSAALEAWYKEFDPGSDGAWQRSDTDINTWTAVTLPAEWASFGAKDFQGLVWFRRSFTVPAAWAGKDLTINLGPINDFDTTWVNGVRVGSDAQWDRPRTYTIPAKVVTVGVNSVTVRASVGGGIFGKPDQMNVQVAGTPSEVVSLAGAWRYKATTLTKNFTPAPFDPNWKNNPNKVTVLSNAMIAPLQPFAIKGVIWYQGESSVNRAYQYRSLLPALIADWRTHFVSGDCPFYIVSLSNFDVASPTPRDHVWAELREAQALVAQTTSNSGLVISIDLGNSDIHASDKREIGHRLALVARAKTYGDKALEWSGPWYSTMKVGAGNITLSFDHVGGGLVAKGGPLRGFAIAGEDKNFVWGDAVIVGSTVVVSSPTVPKPVAVRYAWDVNPSVNLTNREGLPAVPFRTDTWPGLTENSR